MSQNELSERMGFKDRQTLSAIESGIRSLSAEELVLLMEATGQDLDFFTDPYRLVGEGCFSFRATCEHPPSMDLFQDQAGRWIATYRRLNQVQDGSFPTTTPALRLTPDSSFEEAIAAGEQLVREWGLGDVPARKMVEVSEQRLKLLVLYFDGPVDISGAACRLPELDAILVNRNDTPGRRSFDFAHELFHVLTWDRMPPEPVDTFSPKGKIAKRVERLANKFTEALLMPEDSLRTFWTGLDTDKSFLERIIEAARHFLVSSEAMYWRLFRMDLLEEELEPKALPEAHPTDDNPPPLYSRHFLERFQKALGQGQLSVRKTCKLLGVDSLDLPNLFDAQGLTLAK